MCIQSLLAVGPVYIQRLSTGLRYFPRLGDTQGHCPGAERLQIHRCLHLQRRDCLRVRGANDPCATYRPAQCEVCPGSLSYSVHHDHLPEHHLHSQGLCWVKATAIWPSVLTLYFLTSVSPLVKSFKVLLFFPGPQVWQVGFLLLLLLSKQTNKQTEKQQQRNRLNLWQPGNIGLNWHQTCLSRSKMKF